MWNSGRGQRSKDGVDYFFEAKLNNLLVGGLARMNMMAWFWLRKGKYDNDDSFLGEYLEALQPPASRWSVRSTISLTAEEDMSFIANRIIAVIMEYWRQGGEIPSQRGPLDCKDEIVGPAYVDGIQCCHRIEDEQSNVRQLRSEWTDENYQSGIMCWGIGTASQHHSEVLWLANVIEPIKLERWLRILPSIELDGPPQALVWGDRVKKYILLAELEDVWTVIRYIIRVKHELDVNDAKEHVEYARLIFETCPIYCK